MSEETKSKEKLTAVVAPINEKLTTEDKHLLDMERMRKELALSHARNADTAYNNVVLQLALKYKLVEGDSISDEGEIVRKTNAKA
jgi:hypothetical protein